MKRNNIKSAKGFTLVEMLGVLAIIAILVSVVSVGVMSAIKSARITGTVANLKNYETAVAAHIAFDEGNGFMPLTKGTPASIPSTAGATGITAANQKFIHVGQVLIASGAFDQLPAWRVGKETIVGTGHAVWDNDNSGFTVGTGQNDWTRRAHAECVIADAQDTVAKINETAGSEKATFFLTKAIPQGAKVVYVKIPSVSIADALTISKSINRQEHTATAAEPYQLVGKFVFDGRAAGTAALVTGPITAAAAQAGTVNCYYYVGTF